MAMLTWIKSGALATFQGVRFFCGEMLWEVVVLLAPVTVINLMIEESRRTATEMSGAANELEELADRQQKQSRALQCLARHAAAGGEK